jgi:hypothetical protein
MNESRILGVNPTGTRSRFQGGRSVLRDERYS